MYIPPHFRVDEPEVLLDFIESYSFATLVSVAENEPFATHLPLLLEREPLRLLGHVARANPQWRHFAAGGQSLAIFAGPHAYISPAWYQSQPAVPTWNYAAVHVYGTPRLVDESQLSQIVDRLVAKYESPRANPWPNELPADYRAGMLAGIVGFELPIARMEGKFKLSQNRSAADREAVVRELDRGSSESQALSAFMRGQLAGPAR